jgi:hypothetical protein
VQIGKKIVEVSKASWPSIREGTHGGRIIFSDVSALEYIKSCVMWMTKRNIRSLKIIDYNCPSIGS